MGASKPPRDQLDVIRRTRVFSYPWKPLRSHICARISALPFADSGPAMQIKNNILKRLQKFPDSPPFTIVRIAELLVDPQAQGYSLDLEKTVAKYLNSLKRVIFVESLLNEFPEPRRSSPQRLSVSSTTTIAIAKEKSTADHPQAELVDIPWLKKRPIPPDIHDDDHHHHDDLDDPESASVEGNDTNEISSTEDDKGDQKFVTLSGDENILESGALEATDHVDKRPRTNSDDLSFNNSAMDMDISSDSMLDSALESPLESPEREMLSAS